MNKIKEVTVSLSQVVPTGDYKNMKPLLSITFEGEVDIDNAWATLHAELQKEVDRLQTNVKNSQHVPPTPPKAQNDTVNCATHGVPMQEAKSKKTGKYYKYHRSAEGEMCFGQGFQ